MNTRPDPEYNLSALIDTPMPTGYDLSALSDDGFIGAYIAHAIRRADYLYAPAVLAGALTMVAHLTGRNWALKRPQGNLLRANFYALVLGESTIGKNLSLLINDDIERGLLGYQTAMRLLPMLYAIENEIGSAEGLEDVLLDLDGNLLWQLDEAAEVLSVQKNDKIAKAFRHKLLNLYTAKVVMPRRLSMRNRRPEEKIPAPVEYPNLTILAATVPDKFFGSLDAAGFTDGLLNRFCVFYEPVCKKHRNERQTGECDVPTELLEVANEIVRPADATGEPNSVLVTASADVNDLLLAVQDSYDEAFGMQRLDTNDRALLGRAGSEVIPKIALLYAVSERRRSLELRDVRLAETIVFQCLSALLYAIHEPANQENSQHNRDVVIKKLQSRDSWLWRDLSRACSAQMRGAGSYSQTDMLIRQCEGLVREELAVWAVLNKKRSHDTGDQRLTAVQGYKKPDSYGIYICWAEHLQDKLEKFFEGKGKNLSNDI